MARRIYGVVTTNARNAKFVEGSFRETRVDTSRGLGRTGYSSMGFVDVCGMRNRNFPNSDPGTDRNYTYQQQPWDPQRPAAATHQSKRRDNDQPNIVGRTSYKDA